MNFLDWMNMNMIVDIAFLVFSSAIVWKFRNLQKQLLQTRSDLNVIRSDLNVTMKNPNAAKRLLKERR